jgi:hypothetical protein
MICNLLELVSLNTKERSPCIRQYILSIAPRMRLSCQPCFCRGINTHNYISFTTNKQCATPLQVVCATARCAYILGIIIYLLHALAAHTLPSKTCRLWKLLNKIAFCPRSWSTSVEKRENTCQCLLTKRSCVQSALDQKTF